MSKDRIECKYPLKIDGLEVRLYSNDHLPPHFHVIKKGEWEIKVNLLLSGTGAINYEVLWVKKSRGITSKDIEKIKSYVVTYKKMLISTWQLKHEQP